MRDHRSLSVWQEANRITRWVIGASAKNYRPAVRVPFYQLQSSALAIQLHIARGHALRKTRTYTKHLTLAYASAIETHELLQLMEQSHLVPSAEAADALKAMALVKASLVSLIRQYRHYR